MPFAIDTNVLLRMLVDDGSAQCRSASQRLIRDRIFVTVAVMLEAEWVLRSSYRMTPLEISDLFRLFNSNARVEFDDLETVDWATEALRNGFDFADAIHVHAARDCESLLTFDRALIKKAKKHASFVAVISP
jgi:predicted nucleic-acid-binding protein